jgi:hypothetical protein
MKFVNANIQKKKQAISTVGRKLQMEKMYLFVLIVQYRTLDF